VSLEIEMNRMKLLALVESGELSSPRLLELWRDVNVALADKQAAEQRARDGDKLGEVLMDPDSDYARASSRHSALLAAVIAEAELVFGGESNGLPPPSQSVAVDEIESPRPQVLSDDMLMNFSADERIAAEAELLLAEAIERKHFNRSGAVKRAGWDRLRDGRLVLTFVTTLIGGSPVYHRRVIQGRRSRPIYDRSARNDGESYGSRFEKAFRGYWFKRDESGMVVTDEVLAEVRAELDEPA
jgi:hypothetical protein